MWWGSFGCENTMYALLQRKPQFENQGKLWFTSMTHTCTIEPAIPLAKIQAQQHVTTCKENLFSLNEWSFQVPYLTLFEESGKSLTGLWLRPLNAGRTSVDTMQISTKMTQSHHQDNIIIGDGKWDFWEACYKPRRTCYIGECLIVISKAELFRKLILQGSHLGREFWHVLNFNKWNGEGIETRWSLQSLPTQTIPWNMPESQEKIAGDFWMSSENGNNETGGNSSVNISIGEFKRFSYPVMK